ncbi:MAG: hypothetical protein KME20_08425 [Kaiparowitsia implicata GSE-PSE-MK54-09C]|jgi:hypothetical protein|nr:hypothetical protein [Kaiparowitsia implicata GSE-PSE-MK54-09C]
MLKSLTTALFHLPASRRQQKVWFGLSMAIALVYSLPALQEAFSSPYVVQDDARQHIFWMRRFLDPALFPNDAIADYFQSVAPQGYTLFYRLFIAFGLDPILLSKLLPVGLGLVTAALAFGVSWHLLPLPITGFFASVMVSQTLWSHDDLASATPRAFMLPLFMGFLVCLQRRWRWGCWGAIALQGLFYPQYVLVMAGLLALHGVIWQEGRFMLRRDRPTLIVVGGGLLVAALVLLPFIVSTSEYGPTITAAEARQLPEFTDGRSRFFQTDPWGFWLSGMRSGLFPTFKPPLMGLGIFLPLVLGRLRRSPLAQQVQGLGLLWRLPLISLALFLAAHALLFKLHLPSRYTAYTLRFTLIFAAAIALTLVLDGALRWAESHRTQSAAGNWWRSVAVGLLSGAIALALLLFPQYESRFPNGNYVMGAAPRLYPALAQLPPDALIATLVDEADNIPSFTNRSVLVAREYAIPYHVGYYQPFRQRAIALLAAQYSPRPRDLRQFIRQQGITHWLLEDTSFEPGYLRTHWTRQYLETVPQAEANLGGRSPALARLAPPCIIHQADGLQLVDASCLLQPAEDGE